MDYTIERIDDGTARLLLATPAMRVSVDATPRELFRLAADLMDQCYRWDEADERYTLCEECSSVIERTGAVGTELAF